MTEFAKEQNMNGEKYCASNQPDLPKLKFDVGGRARENSQSHDRK